MLLYTHFNYFLLYRPKFTLTYYFCYLPYNPFITKSNTDTFKSKLIDSTFTDLYYLLLAPTWSYTVSIYLNLPFFLSILILYPMLLFTHLSLKVLQPMLPPIVSTVAHSSAPNATLPTLFCTTSNFCISFSYQFITFIQYIILGTATDFNNSLNTSYLFAWYLATLVKYPYHWFALVTLSLFFSVRVTP